MTKFKLISCEDKLWRSGYMAIYGYNVVPQEKEAVIINAFLEEKNYTIEDKSSLGQPFNLNLLSYLDFKQYSRNELITFFNHFSDPKGWSRPEEIKEELNYFNALIEQYETNSFYFLSPELFNGNDPKVKIEGRAYIYYFLIIWFNNNTMNICQMCLD